LFLKIKCPTQNNGSDSIKALKYTNILGVYGLGGLVIEKMYR